MTKSEHGIMWQWRIVRHLGVTDIGLGSRIISLRVYTERKWVVF